MPLPPPRPSPASPPMTRTLPLLLLAVGVLPSPASADGAVDFAHDVVPILRARCARCHTNGTYKGGLSFDTRADVLKAKAAVPGKAAESELVRRVTSADP